MDLGIKGRVALVHGGGGGLGSAISLALAQEGCLTAVCDVNLDAAQATAQRISTAGGRAIAVQWDLADAAAHADRHAQIVAELGEVDILVNNTGGPPPTTAKNADPALWARFFDEMVLSVIQITDLVLPSMEKKGWGRIITSTSSGVIVPIPNLAISNALRMSLVGWSKTLAREVAPSGITANIVLPGRIATARIQQLDEAKAARDGVSIEQIQKASTQTIPMQRYGRTEEYGQVVAFLASQAASYVTGSVMRVDGGLIANI
ncbi:SDR family oxidoreductase [Alcaligenaceae bacterium CGII-47]|nr:SDR family oxidoreductase [Alcaligenaceae bacterium CGII-47]